MLNFLCGASQSGMLRSPWAGVQPLGAEVPRRLGQSADADQVGQLRRDEMHVLAAQNMRLVTSYRLRALDAVEENLPVCRERSVSRNGSGIMPRMVPLRLSRCLLGRAGRRPATS